MTDPRYTDEELEIQYNNQRRVPEHPAILDDWVARTRALGEQRHCTRDLAYGDAERERLDLYPADASGSPLLVYVHGGYWQRGDKSIYGFVAAGPLAHGISVAVINYDLCPQVGLAHIAPQVARAVASLVVRAEELGCDPSRVLVAGHSAGGHLVARLRATDFSRVERALAPCPLRGALAVSGVFDLAPLLPTSINHAVGMDAATARAESPLLQQPAAGRCPLVAAVGGAESEEFHRQSRAMAERWASALPTRYLDVPGANHFTVLESLADPRGALCAALVEMDAAGTA